MGLISKVYHGSVKQKYVEECETRDCKNKKYRGKLCGACFNLYASLTGNYEPYGRCATDRCDNARKSRELCQRCRDKTKASREKRAAICDVDGCPWVVYSSGKCIYHWHPVHIRRACKVPSCGRMNNAKGYCQIHYNHWKNFGDPLAGPFKVEEYREPRKCKVEGCDRSSEYYHGGSCRMCGMHAAQVRKHGKITNVLPSLGPQVGECEAFGCKAEKKTRGLCSKHYARRRVLKKYKEQQNGSQRS